MAKHAQNVWIWIIIALVIGIAVGYAAAGGFSTSGKAIARQTISVVPLQGSCSGVSGCSQQTNKEDCEALGCTWKD